MEGSVFLNQLFQDNNVEEDFSEHIEWENQQTKFKDTDLGDYKIPFTTHRIWFTNAAKPRQLSNDKLYKELTEEAQIHGYRPS